MTAGPGEEGGRRIVRALLGAAVRAIGVKGVRGYLPSRAEFLAMAGEVWDAQRAVGSACYNRQSDGGAVNATKAVN